MLAVQADGCSIQTIESLSAQGAELHPIQQALSHHHGLQCGYCTPGVVMTLLELDHDRHGRALDETEIRAALSGNLCRCTGYQGIVDAALALYGDTPNIKDRS
jgi:carbon-monoxide dehydrogenase small subunit